MTEKTIITRSNLSNVQRFVAKFAEPSVGAEREHGLPAEAMLAQAALETGWGSHILKGKDKETGKTVSSNNLFNIKKGSSWQGPVVVKRVHEYDAQGKKYYTTDPFRRYARYQESFEDYCRLILSLSCYTPAVHAAGKGDIEGYLKALTGVYATDPKYHEKCLKIISKYFDVTVVNNPDPPAVPKTEKTSCGSGIISGLKRALKRSLGKKE